MHKTNGRGTFTIDRRFPHVGRIKRASGVRTQREFRELVSILTAISFAPGGVQLLLDVKEGRIRPVELLHRYRYAGLDVIHDGVAGPPINDVVVRWLEDAPCSAGERSNRRGAWKRILAGGPLPLADLPDRVRELRVEDAAHHPARFNRHKSAVQAFLRDEVGRRHPVYGAVADLPKLTERPARTPATRRQLLELQGQLEDGPWGVLRTLVTTGMGRKEYWSTPWDDCGDRIAIAGTKRAARVRVVPRVYPPAPASIPYRDFTPLIRPVKPYDLRATYAIALEESGIPEGRQKYYMGHGAATITQRYQRRAERTVEPHLEEDAASLRGWFRFDR